MLSRAALAFLAASIVVACGDDAAAHPSDGGRDAACTGDGCSPLPGTDGEVPSDAGPPPWVPGACVEATDCGASEECLDGLCSRVGVWVADDAVSATNAATLRDATFDDAGNLYVVGTFRGTMDFAGATHTTSSRPDVFVASWSAAGVQRWLRPFTSTRSTTNEEVGHRIVWVGDGVVVVGAAADADFGAGERTSNPELDAFAVKLTPDGAHAWEWTAGGDLDDHAFDVALASTGELYVVGDFQLLADLGGGERGPEPGRRGFVVVLSAAGEHVRDWLVGVDADAVMSALVVDGADGVVLAGNHQAGVDFGGGARTTGGIGPALVAYDPMGAYQWDWTGGAMGVGNFSAVGRLSDGRVVAGLRGFSGTLDFGGTMLPVEMGDSVALLAFDADGTPSWHAPVTGAEGCFGVTSVRVTDDQIYAGGDARCAGPVQIGTEPRRNRGGTDAFVARWSTEGEHRWDVVIGGPDVQTLGGIAVDTGRLIAVGSSVGDIDFGGGVRSFPVRSGFVLTLAR